MKNIILSLLFLITFEAFSQTATNETTTVAADTNAAATAGLVISVYEKAF